MTLLNKDVDSINEEILNMIPGYLYELKSSDDLVEANDTDDTNNYSTEYLNELSFSNMPPHNLKSQHCLFITQSRSSNNVNIS